ncbi:D-inositol-3-phosphate glycosyltransferase [Ardenticatena maritima]|uniref:D-inositol-3-phosphate glycosyltransferase n=2 Tax=Ardenticatena maritima TaxID=872965 RepID=A0A0M8K9G8_9CHLR|nr:glycosyltransferase [Ardenticatena maritima]GAP63199.1 D-inositol-3-phosphate glycosyltransferase [Ardenticatena maritima]
MHIETECCHQVGELFPTSSPPKEKIRWRIVPRGRIAMLSVHTCPLAMLGGKNTGGMNVYVRELSRQLGARGWQVDIFTHAENMARPLIVQMSENVRVIHIVAGPVRHIGKNELYHYLPEFTENVLRFATLEGHTYDIIHSHYWLSGLVAQALREAWGAPIAHMYHTLGVMKNAVARSEAERELDIRIRSEAQIARAVDRLVAATPIDRAQILEHYPADPSKIEVIPCGVDLDLFHPIPKREARRLLGIPDDHKLILFVGRIDPLKGIDALIEAIAEVVRREPAWRERLCLSIIGGSAEDAAQALTAEMRRLHALRAELDIEDVVTFLGAQSQETLPYFYSAAEMVVMPSHYESFGMVALEAMACGTPVIASDVGGLTYTVQDGVTGYLVPPRRPDILADRILELLNDVERRREMGRNGVKRAERFGWPAITRQIERLYAELRILA